VTLLAIRGLHAGYGRARVLHDLDLDVEEGAVVGVLGANGAGKTTLLRALSGMTWREGSIAFAGAELAGEAADAIAAHGIGHVPQGRGTFPRLSVRDNLLAGALRRRDRAAVRADLDHWLSFFPVLGARLRQPAGLMSGGEQQMLAIARALMGRPRLLLLDEPSAGLAPVVVETVVGALGEINARFGTTLLVVEQNARAIAGLVRHGAVLANGTIAGVGPLAELASAGVVRRAYLGS